MKRFVCSNKSFVTAFKSSSCFACLLNFISLSSYRGNQIFILFIGKLAKRQYMVQTRLVRERCDFTALKTT